VSVGTVDWITTNWVSSQGTSSLDLVGSFAVGGVAQTFDTVPGTTYVVAFDLAGNPGGPPAVKPLAVTVNGVTSNFTFDTTGRSGAAMGWPRHSLTFTASGTSSTIAFVSDVTGTGTNAGAALDNVTITAQGAAAAATEIPLPWAHVGAALLVLLGSRGPRSAREALAEAEQLRRRVHEDAPAHGQRAVRGIRRVRAPRRIDDVDVGIGGARRQDEDARVRARHARRSSRPCPPPSPGPAHRTP